MGATAWTVWPGLTTGIPCFRNRNEMNRVIATFATSNHLGLINHKVEVPCSDDPRAGGNMQRNVDWRRRAFISQSALSLSHFKKELLLPAPAFQPCWGLNVLSPFCNSRMTFLYYAALVTASGLLGASMSTSGNHSLGAYLLGHQSAYSLDRSRRPGVERELSQSQRPR